VIHSLLEVGCFQEGLGTSVWVQVFDSRRVAGFLVIVSFLIQSIVSALRNGRWPRTGTKQDSFDWKFKSGEIESTEK
jgi:hypothetical protein